MVKLNLFLGAIMACIPIVSVGGGNGFMLGVDVFIEGHSHLVSGKRVALLTNQSGLDAQGRSTIDRLFASPDVNLVRLFSPEHGIRGKVLAGLHVDDSVDEKTGLQIISLYGKNGYRPKPQHLQGIDVVIYDIQDVGSRAYTYIWSLGETMTACGELGIEVVVLDRPCVFGGTVIDGPVCDTRIKSLLTRFPIPRVYGMTCGEIARLFNAEHGLNCHLTIIPMANYTRGMLFENTGLNWTAPSPNIPNLNAARCFPATGTLGVLGKVHIGIGTNMPFQIIGAPWLNNQQMLQDFNGYGIPGVVFGASNFQSPKGAFFPNQQINSLTISVTEPSTFMPARLELLLYMYLLQNYSAELGVDDKALKAFDRAMGTSSVSKAVFNGDGYEKIIKRWSDQQRTFMAKRQKFLLYE